MEFWLLNAAHMKAVPGRKTDVRDAVTTGLWTAGRVGDPTNRYQRTVVHTHTDGLSPDDARRVAFGKG